MESFNEILEAGVQVQPMQAETLGFAQFGGGSEVQLNGPNFNVLPSVDFPFVMKRRHNALQCLTVVNQQLAMVGKG
jgi:hypothetical protein